MGLYVSNRFHDTSIYSYPWGSNVPPKCIKKELCRRACDNGLQTERIWKGRLSVHNVCHEVEVSQDVIIYLPTISAPADVAADVQEVLYAKALRSSGNKARDLKISCWGCNISNTRDSLSSGYPNTEKRVENTTRSGVFLTKFEVLG